MYVIGTAGHVDHGKSTLIEAITGRHPDRLTEERERQMSIVLGFDSLHLPDGKEVSIVDVPGHRDFIENMLSGVGAIDATVFVVAADEGVMPQTREHLAILDLLGIDSGVLAITKVDLIDDPEWLDLVELEIHELIQDTVLNNAPVVRVSARTGAGMGELIDALTRVLEGKSPRQDLGRPRLSVDRAFSVAGFGTVVTGTLLDGSFEVGDEVVVLPQGLRGRIRGLQSHNQNQERIQPGTRTAVNISGVDVQEIQRGDLIAFPGDYRPTRRLDVRFQYLPDVEKPLSHNTEAKLFLGADETIARVRLLGRQQLLPGETGWLQLEASQPVVALRGDRYILRQPSPSVTVGGGMVVDPHPKKRYRRFDEQNLQRLEALTSQDPAEIVRQILQKEGNLPWEVLALQTSLEEEQLTEAVDQLVEEGFAAVSTAAQGRGRWVSARNQWEQLKNRLLTRIDRYHNTYPLRLGMPREELKSQSGIPDQVFEQLLAELISADALHQQGPQVADPAHRVEFSAEQQKKVSALLEKFAASPYSPPTVSESQQLVGEDLFDALVALGKLKKLSEEVVFTTRTYQQMLTALQAHLKEHETITVAEARDLFQSSRRYMLALLEALDAEKITIREGDYRRLRQ